jgi:hypothetical protein
MIEKISRISWNADGWAKPSGRKGKSTNLQTFEARYGYGYEEWLFDMSKTIEAIGDKYHYSFLQPLHLGTDKHIGKSYKIWLYTFTEGRKLLVGSIENAICISKNESERIYKRYREKGWLDEMAKDLKDVNTDPKKFKETDSNILFNIKFRLEDVKIYDSYRVISSNDPNVTTMRFKLLNKKYEFK